jgi:hypothetical protein
MEYDNYTHSDRGVIINFKIGRRSGFNFAIGAIFAVCLCLALSKLFSWALDGTGWPDRDDTDGPAERSGMQLLTDHGTGCQYLKTISGITPRLAPDGRQVCR